MPDILAAQDADLARYRSLHAGLNGPLPHLDLQDARAQRDRRDRIPHIDAAARRREARNALIRGLDRLISDAAVATAAVGGVVGLGAAVRVVALYVGGVL
ncbi:hypothetical protein VQ02_19755 [Methylobacterium variabile]|uniref:Uncharacterized protein n=1 Tax=Methylobacterium variabile TaxID=298794 RepID=A0A0J6SJQ8_9HYPH|nr:hypothetical protein [Methylobacterium variabile]KMO33887.1 hypothetical protein VQ02_19755 [Methylobacterium variabile]